MNYLSWNQITIADFSEANVSAMYSRGYVFTRLGRGMMQQTRSVRIDLSKFSLTSENRRIFKKTTEMSEPTLNQLPLKDYDFKLGKLAKDFYDTKFGPGIMSAQKVKEMLTDASKSNFNTLLRYSINTGSIDTETAGNLVDSQMIQQNHTTMTTGQNCLGYAICMKNSSILHYSYPFYDLTVTSKDTGLGMMIRAIEYAKAANLKFVYLGSLQRPTDTYKLQFDGLEWFDGKEWQTDLQEVKRLLNTTDSNADLVA